MYRFIKSISKENKFFTFLLLLTLFIILFTLLVKSYFFGTISSNWNQVSEEKRNDVTSKCTEVFYGYQSEVSNFTSLLLQDKRFIAAIKSQNTKKAYDAFFEHPESQNFNIEVYNTRFEQFMFSGRQLSPEILELKNAYETGRFSAIKNSGLYTDLIIYEPVKDDNGALIGVLAAGSIIDVNSDIQNTYFENRSITRDIFKTYHINVQFEFNNEAFTSQTNVDDEFSKVELKGIDNKVIGRILIPSLDQESYINSINIKFDNMVSFLLFTASCILIIWIYIVMRRFLSGALRTSVIVLCLVLARYFWLSIDFPSSLFTDFGTDFFSPVYYASGFGYGIAKSLGELTITSIVMFICTFLIFRRSVSFFKSEHKVKKSIYKSVAAIVVCSAASILSIHFYGLVIQSLIYDSTIKFIDKTDLFSFNQPELIIARLLLILFSISLLFVIYSAGLVSIKYATPFIKGEKVIRKNSAIVFVIFLCIIIPIAVMSGIEFSMMPGLFFLILLIAGLYLLYLQRKLYSTRYYNIVNIFSLSFLLLSCTVFIPIIILTKITSQENRYLEKAARDISQRNEDKAGFLVTSTINEIALNEQLVNDVKDRNKINNLAFTIWSTSNLNDEDVNSAVFILDSNKRLISDFNIIPSELKPDSVIKFVSINEGKNGGEEEDYEPSVESDTTGAGYDSELEPIGLVNEPEVMVNKDGKYYAAVLNINSNEKPRIHSVAASIVVVCSYDSKNYVRQSNLSIFKSFARENILNKLTSTPVFSEFTYDELTGSSNKDISKSFIKSLSAFKESVKDKPVKSALRFDQFENESYKSFYVLSEAAQNIPEKIYVVSVKINDFALSSFFFFRFLLFSAALYSIILLVYILIRIIRIILNIESISSFRFGFREKLFVSFLIASVLPIIILALYTREYVKTKNEESYNNQLISDLRLIEQYVKNRLTVSVKTEKDLKKESEPPLTDVFGKELSESNKNFNLYFKNRIAATTSEHLYKSGLLDARISGQAFYNIALLKKDFYSENQQIGDFTFIAGYKPVFDSYNYLTGIISTQTVFKQYEINQELTESLVYIFGPYIVAVIMLIFIVNVLSYRISNPILKLQKATEQLSKGIIDVEVKSKTEDEIGNLVKSFNRMVKELKRAQEELKVAERETAWRDIARQVAHEIKNPLTPMKLAMQHLYNSYSTGSKNFKTILASTNKMIIDQIEILNKIATEFSDFAKMPGKNYELLNTDEILKNVVQLMNAKRNIDLETPENGRNNVWGDKDELKRAVINILKNSQQAIDECDYTDGKGKISVSSKRDDGNYHVFIKDNGCGMDKKTISKLFEPYFSTKSSGMGLGLVITKKILDEMKAKIKVKSVQGKGTEVEIVFKLVK